MSIRVRWALTVLLMLIWIAGVGYAMARMIERDSVLWALVICGWTLVCIGVQMKRMGGLK